MRDFAAKICMTLLIFCHAESQCRASTDCFVQSSIEDIENGAKIPSLLGPSQCIFRLGMKVCDSKKGGLIIGQKVPLMED